MSTAQVFGKFVGALGIGLPLLVETVILLWIAKLIRDAVTPFDHNKEMFKSDNHALGIATAGYYFGVLIALSGVLFGPSQGFWIDILGVAIYGILAILLINIARWTTDKLVLRSFDINKELSVDKNIGTGWAMFGVYFAVGMVVRGAVIGESADLLSGIGTTVYYFVLGQIAMILVAFLYQVITPYDFHAEIEKDNASAGLAFGGFISALGVIIGNSGGEKFTWPDTFSFILYTAAGVILLAMTRYIVAEHILIPGHKIAKEIVNDQNENAAWMLAASYHATAWIFVLAV